MRELVQGPGLARVREQGLALERVLELVQGWELGHDDARRPRSGTQPSGHERYDERESHDEVAGNDRGHRHRGCLRQKQQEK